MSRLAQFLSRLRALLTRNKLDAEMAKELASHLEMRTQRNIESGMEADEARYAAMRAFGCIEQVKESLREERSWQWIDHASQDFRYAFRQLRKAPVYSATAILSLALGIGATTAMFSFVHAVLLSPLPYPQGDRLVSVVELGPQGNPPAGAAALTFFDWRRQQTSFESFAAFSGFPVTIGGDTPQTVGGARMSAGFFEVYGITAALGRTFISEDESPDGEQVALLSDGIWKSRFGSDPQIVGKTLILDGEPSRIIGVLRPSPMDRAWTGAVWRPLRIRPENLTRNYFWLLVVAKLKPGVSVPQANTEMEAIAGRLARANPDNHKGWSARVLPLADEVVTPRNRQALGFLFSGVILVFLIACANVANLTLTRSFARAHELSIRSSLGASRARIVRQLLTETFVLASTATLIGVLGGYGMLQGLKASAYVYLSPPSIVVQMNYAVLIFAVILGAATTVACGIWPALFTSRIDLVRALKKASAQTTENLRLARVFVVLQLAMSAVLLTGTGLMVRSLMNLREVEVGRNPANVLAAVVPIAEKWRTSPDKFNGYLRTLIDAIKAVPGVEGVAMASGAPLRPTHGMGFQIAGKPPLENGQGCFFKTTTPGYFSVVGLRVVKGRALNERDGVNAPRVAVINEIFARKCFPGEDPVGQRVLIDDILLEKEGTGSQVAWEIVGVVENERVYSLTQGDVQGIYVPSEQSPQIHQSVVIRTAQPAAAVQSAVLKAVVNINSDQQLVGLKTVADMKSEDMQDNRMYLGAIGAFAAVAILLASTGVYGVVAYTVVRRTREIGIRAALGATRSHILRLFMGDSLALIAVGVVVGGFGAFALVRSITSLLYGVSPWDPAIATLVVVVLLSVGLGGTFFPARRATKVDPMVALRCE